MTNLNQMRHRSAHILVCLFTYILYSGIKSEYNKIDFLRETYYLIMVVFLNKSSQYLKCQQNMSKGLIVKRQVLQVHPDQVNSF